MGLILCGDLHGLTMSKGKIYKLAQRYPNDLIIQLGDYGFNDDYEKSLHKLDPDYVKILPGNHDDHTEIYGYPHCLGRFGVFEYKNKKIFFVCGAYSTDKNQRDPYLDWWPEEELNWKETEDCLVLWEKECKTVDLVLTHEAPVCISYQLLNKLKLSVLHTHTSLLLWEIYKIHQPPYWYFGHYHTQFKKKYGSTLFQCLSINESIKVF